jgi:hypothetical protein
MEVNVRRFSKLLLTGALTVAGGSLAWFAGSSQLFAADHLDPPSRTDLAVNPRADVAADIADLYLYHTATSVIVAVDFAGPQAATMPAVYDRDVDYTISLSNAGATTDAEFNINFRFGQDPTKPGSNGVRITGVPGTTGPIMGSVETQGGVNAFAGLIDDPFNFDVIGFRQTRDTGTLAFNNQRNFFAGLNSTVLVLEIPLSALRNGTNPITAWVTSARIVAA